MDTYTSKGEKLFIASVATVTLLGGLAAAYLGNSENAVTSKFNASLPATITDIHPESKDDFYVNGVHYSDVDPSYGEAKQCPEQNRELTECVTSDFTLKIGAQLLAEGDTVVLEPLLDN